MVSRSVAVSLLVTGAVAAGGFTMIHLGHVRGAASHPCASMHIAPTFRPLAARDRHMPVVAPSADPAAPGFLAVR